MGKDVKRYEYPEPENVVIFPYLIKNGTPELMSAEYMENNFPLGWKYLLKNRKALEEREKGRMRHEKFYAYIYPKNLSEFEAVKIMTRDIAGYCEFTIDDNFLYHTTTVYSFVFSENIKEKLFYWLGILNSSLFWFFLVNTGNVLRGGFFRFKTNYLKPFPIKRIDFSNEYEFSAHDSIVNLVSYILFLKSRKKPINKALPNDSIAQTFEKVIDAMVMELYFEQEFHEKDLYFIKYAERDFNSIENLESDDEKAKVINEAYQKLRQKDNEIRNNLKLMDIKLPNIVGPIKSVR